MPLWQAATGVFFIYIGIVGMLVPGLPPARRRLVLAGTAVGLALAGAATFTSSPLLLGWFVPPAALLLAYWTSGLTFAAPMPRVERWLLGWDRRLRIGRLAAAAPRPIAELLESAYAAVYPVIPIALIIHLTTNETPDPSRFWSVILVTDYICFGALPWVQTRPPRALEPGGPWTSRMRAFNVRLLGRTSIHVNTFPSGHAAEALSAALLVHDAPQPVFAVMLLIALAISAGAVLGRYHYAIDAVTGWLVAVLVWLAAGRD